jgi:hypothetical protein
MYLSTHYSLTEDSALFGYPGTWYEEGGRRDPLSGLGAESFWPTRDGLIAMLADSGWCDVRVTFDRPEFPHGPLICLRAEQRAE